MATEQERQPDPVLVNDWHVVAISEDIAEGTVHGTTLLGEDLVIWRHAGQVQVWKDICIHRGARFSKGWVTDGTLVCPYHGWRYDTAGKCVHIPAQPDVLPPPKARAQAYKVVERYGFVWATPGDPPHDVPHFPEAEDPSFRVFTAGPYEFGNAFRSVENFLDAPHFPFVHPSMNGEFDTPDPINDYEVTTGPEGLRTSSVFVFQRYGDHRQIPVNAEYKYRCHRPTTAGFNKQVRITDPAQAHLGSDKDVFAMMLNAQPIDEFRSLIRLSVAINFGPELTQADIRRRQDAVFAQDAAIVAIQRPARLPIDLRAELHIRADRMAVAYRRWLGALGVTYGTT